MTSELQIFKNQKFGQVRTVDVNGKIHFVATDITSALGYIDGINAVKRHCRWVAKCHIPHPQSKDKSIEVNAIPEGDIYRLVAGSELSGAAEFESWIFDEVLPSIRKHGMYAKDELLDNPDLLIEVATRLKEERQKRIEAEQVIELNKPKVLFADSVAASNTTILIGELAKLLKQNGIEIGEKRLFNWLRQNKYLISRRGTDHNAPTQKSMRLELFTVKETTISHSDGHITVSKTTKVTGKGQQYFINKFLGKSA